MRFRHLVLLGMSSFIGIGQSYCLSKDYVLTIGGGFSPQGNQASLEANVLFFNKVLLEQSPKVESQPKPNLEHKVYFADGFDPKSDLQIVAPKTVAESPAIELLNTIFFDGTRDRVSYRNHTVPDIAGGIAPSEIEAGFDELASNLTAGDRLIVYVTAHGSAATGDNKMDTSIACWNREKIQMSKFSKWLDDLPSSVPVIMIMAQCYCGGFSNTIYQQGDPANGLSEQVRVGFFAQRHDLPAAGCRPDIENDQEYSSYFWGAFMGRLRSGTEIENVDCDGDKRISFAEAHAYAVLESPTIDIPLRTSDEFLRRYSQIAEYETPPLGTTKPEVQENVATDISYMSGTIGELASSGRPELRRCVLGLASQLGLSADDAVSVVLNQKNEAEETFNQSRQRPSRGGPRGARGGRNSRRRDLRQELIAKWPELADPKQWKELSWLKREECDSFMEEVQQLSNYEPFQKSLAERSVAREKSTAAELRLVRFRRLIYTIESIVLDQNLPKVANSEILSKYKSILDAEGSSL